MKARVIKEGSMYVGEVYGTWTNYLLGTKYKGWNSVTTRCFTEIGARVGLEQWKRKNYPEEFEL